MHVFTWILVCALLVGIASGDDNTATLNDLYKSMMNTISNQMGPVAPVNTPAAKQQMDYLVNAIHRVSAVDAVNTVNKINIAGYGQVAFSPNNVIAMRAWGTYPNETVAYNTGAQIVNAMAGKGVSSIGSFQLIDPNQIKLNSMNNKNMGSFTTLTTRPAALPPSRPIQVSRPSIPTTQPVKINTNNTWAKANIRY